MIIKIRTSDKSNNIKLIKRLNIILRNMNHLINRPNDYLLNRKKLPDH